MCSVTSNSLWSHGLQPARLLCPWGFSRQEYWSGLPCPPPGDLPRIFPDPGDQTQISRNAGGFFIIWATKEAQWLRIHLPMQEIQEMQVWSLGWEDSLEEEMTTHSSILAWRTPWTEEPGGLQSMGSQRVGHDWATKHSTAHPSPLCHLGSPKNQLWGCVTTLGPPIEILIHRSGIGT